MSPNVFDPNRLWTPARYVATPQWCHFCGAFIPRSAPGPRVGDRGTKAYYNSSLRLFECIECRAEATRADLALIEIHERSRPATESCVACGYERSERDLSSELPIFRLIPCPGCQLGEGSGLHRVCPRCRHVEHRSHVAGQPWSRPISPVTESPAMEAS